MKHILLAPLLGFSLAVPAAADIIPLPEISQYLNSFTTARAGFTQVNGDGSVSTGTLHLRRPNRARFDYDDDAGLVIAGGGQVAIFDPVSNTTPEQYPLRRTPLVHILARTVDLEASGQLVAHEYDGTATSVELQDPEAPERGTIRLVFTDAPTALRQWVILNESGDETTVILGDLATGIEIPPSTFSIVGEKRARGLE